MRLCSSLNASPAPDLVLGKLAIMEGERSRQEKVFYDRRGQSPWLDLPELHLAEVRQRMRPDPL